jgi:phage tail-like protein
MAPKHANTNPEENYRNQNTRVHSNSFFYVDIGDERAVFSEVTGLQAETEITPFKEGGFNEQAHMLPGSTKVGNITLKRGISQSNVFFSWYLTVMNGKVSRRDVLIKMYFNGRETPLYVWQLVKAFPCKWSGPNFNAKDSVIAIETLELAHEGLILIQGGN